MTILSQLDIRCQVCYPKTMKTTKTHRINARLTDQEKKLLDDLMKVYDKDLSAVVRFAIKTVWYETFINRNGKKDYPL